MIQQILCCAHQILLKSKTSTNAEENLVTLICGHYHRIYVTRSLLLECGIMSSQWSDNYKVTGLNLPPPSTYCHLLLQKQSCQRMVSKSHPPIHNVRRHQDNSSTVLEVTSELTSHNLHHQVDQPIRSRNIEVHPVNSAIS